jgi:hypothetical protein
MAAHQSGMRVSAGSIGGVVALASTCAVIGSFFVSPAIDPSALNYLALGMGGVAGVVALLRPRDIEALVVADVLVGLALAPAMYSRGGLIYLPALFFLALGTAQARSREESEAEAFYPVAPTAVRNITPEPEDLEEAV